jgi:hypothetical protein
VRGERRLREFARQGIAERAQERALVRVGLPEQLGVRGLGEDAQRAGLRAQRGAQRASRGGLARDRVERLADGREVALRSPRQRAARRSRNNCPLNSQVKRFEFRCPTRAVRSSVKKCHHPSDLRTVLRGVNTILSV